jgi:hypothetical protein
MPNLTINDVDIGDKIRFRSKNLSDETVWVGTLLSRGSYRGYKAFLSNPIPYNNAVRQVDATVTSDVTELTYFMVEIDNGAENPVTRIFANEWITAGSLSVITEGVSKTIKVDIPDGNIENVVALLASAGYLCKIIS